MDFQIVFVACLGRSPLAIRWQHNTDYLMIGLGYRPTGKLIERIARTLSGSERA